MSLKAIIVSVATVAITASLAYAEPVYMFRFGYYSRSADKASAPLAITEKMPSTVTTGQNFSYTFSGTGGKLPYRWSVSGGAPSGLAIDEYTGVLSGTISGSGTYNYVIRLTDADGNFIEEQVSQVVDAPDPVVVSMVSGGTPITLSSQVQPPSIWTDPNVPKIINLPSGVIRGTSNPGVAAVSIGTPWAGTLTFNVNGEIQGAPGAGNGGKGGDALNINTTGLNGEKIVINRTGLIRAGGGGGGRGGNGGKGGDGIDNGTVTPGGAGAIGSSGGGGVGYNVPYPLLGILGSPGQNGGVNAGQGGWSGMGGNGGFWGASGSPGSTGQKGSDGNHPTNGTGEAGTIGSPGGPPGIAIVNISDAIIN
ncbi:Ig domain-containing protein [Mesorhizobium sp. SP-1A]|uniref:Ig domain-containing protein n=1 Tax=Mesorhizobium sp. SP-1A TaxID=3077840 RepID=UPI0028F71633|nr:Ig domain-containing protein [Mesorhizobium sp. SP-1A]